MGIRIAQHMILWMCTILLKGAHDARLPDTILQYLWTLHACNMKLFKNKTYCLNVMCWFSLKSATWERASLQRGSPKTWIFQEKLEQCVKCEHVIHVLCKYIQPIVPDLDKLDSWVTWEIWTPVVKIKTPFLFAEAWSCSLCFQCIKLSSIIQLCVCRVIHWARSV